MGAKQSLFQAVEARDIATLDDLASKCKSHAHRCGSGTSKVASGAGETIEDSSDSDQICGTSGIQAQIEEVNDEGRTPLLVACALPATNDKLLSFWSSQQNADSTILLLCVALLRLGSKVDHVDSRGDSALHLACRARNYSVIPKLLQFGAVPQRNSGGLLPQDLLEPLFDDGHDQQRYGTRLGPLLGCWSMLRAATPDEAFQLRVSSRTCEFGAPLSVQYSGSTSSSQPAYIQLLIGPEDAFTAISSAEDFVEESFELGEYKQIQSCPSPTPAADSSPTTVASAGSPLAISTLPSANPHRGTLHFRTDTLPLPCICRFLYIVSDKSMTKRQVVAVSPAVWISSNVGKYAFSVGGIEFRHDDESLDGKEFTVLEEFKTFMASIAKDHSSETGQLVDDAGSAIAKEARREPEHTIE